MWVLVAARYSLSYLVMLPDGWHNVGIMESGVKSLGSTHKWWRLRLLLLGQFLHHSSEYLKYLPAESTDRENAKSECT